MSKIVTEIADYKPQYRDHTTLRINLIGDIIESTAEHVGGDMRFLVVDSGTDADKTLDNPIKRFTWQGE